MAPDDGRRGSGELDAAPPFASWPRIYALVAGALAAQVIVFAILTAIYK
jgi:hypothetical protein